MARKRKKKKSSVNRLQYMKQRKRLSSMVSRLRKQGYDVNLATVAGDIPKRITKQAIQRLSNIRSSKELVKKLKLTKQQAPQVTTKAPTLNDLIMQNFQDKFSNYHHAVQNVIMQWKDAVIETYGMQAFLDALEDADYEGIELSDYGGYLIPPEDLSLYLNRLTHFILPDKSDTRLDIFTSQVDQIINEYELTLPEYELEEYGSYYSKGSRGWAGHYVR